MNRKNIVLTGGHAATTAIATIYELEKLIDKDVGIHWMGVRKAVEGKNTLTLEAKILPEMGVKFHNLITGRIQSKYTRHTLISLAKIPIGFVHALIILFQLRPKVVLSFGGFAAFPVVFWAKIMGTTVIIHEQTSVIGSSNKYSAFFADIVAISRLSSKKYYKHKKVVHTGNPILHTISSLKPKNKISKNSTVLIMGGSRGSMSVNELVIPVLDKILKEYSVIHLSGEFDFEKLLELKSSLPKNLAYKYNVKQWTKPQNMHKLYAKSDLAISRAGANTVSELLFCQIPTVFIPIPWSKYDEQTKNAQFAVDKGFGIILNQDKTSPKEVFNSLNKLKNKLANKAKTTTDTNQDEKAAQKLANLVIKQIQ